VLRFVQGVALGFSASASPGPFQAFLLAQALANGALRSLPLALAPLASDGPIIALMLLVLSRAPAGFLRALEVLGGLLLVWIARGTFRALRAAPSTDTAAPPAERPARGFAKAVGMNALSPGPWIFWSTVSGPILVESWRASPASALWFLAGFYLLLCGGNAALVIVFSSARRLGAGPTRVLTAAAAAVLLGFGAWQVLRALATS
jgi:threonine/homoserine/homoserine lactone efflux protein